MGRVTSGSIHAFTIDGTPDGPGLSVKCKCGWEESRIARYAAAKDAGTRHLRATRDDEVWVDEGWDY